VALSKEDWDSDETSWDFLASPWVACGGGDVLLGQFWRYVTDTIYSF
jgi:hypothetical protein